MEKEIKRPHVFTATDDDEFCAICGNRKENKVWHIQSSFCEHGVPKWASCPACPNSESIISALEEKIECNHQCSSNCRRNGCNCEHGEWHEINESDV